MELQEPDSGEITLSGFPLSGEEIINRHWAKIEKGILQFDEFMEHKCPEIAGVMLWSGSHPNWKEKASLSWDMVRDSIAFYMEKNEYLKEGQIPQWEEPEPKETEVYQQLSLFPTIEEQIGTIEAAQAGEKYIMPAAFSLPKEQQPYLCQVPAGEDTGGNGGVFEKRIPDYRERF